MVRYGPRGRVYAGVRAAERRSIVRERGACQRFLDAGCRLMAQSRAGHGIGTSKEDAQHPGKLSSCFSACTTDGGIKWMFYTWMPSKQGLACSSCPCESK